MADEQKPLVETGGRMPFRYSLGRLYTEFQKQLQRQQSRQLQFKTNAANVLLWKWSDETAWKEVAVMSSTSAATSIAGVAGLQDALDEKRDAGVINIKDIDGLDEALRHLGLWDSIKNKPETYPPSQHGHQIADVSGLREELDGKKDDGDIDVSDVVGLDERLESLEDPQWSDIKGKPETFPPSTHKHAVSDVTGLQDALDAAGKPKWIDVADKPQTFPPDAHKHPISDVNGLQDALTSAGKPGWDNVTGKPATYPPASHKHGIADVTGLQTALDGKRDAGKIPTSDVTGLDDQLKGIGAAPAWSAVTNKPTTFAPSSHQHEIADVNGLRAALDAGLKSEVVEGKVVTAGQKVAVKFSKSYATPPAVVPNSIWVGSQEVLGQASEITITGCNVTVMQSTGTLLLNGSPFGTAPAGTTFRMLVIGS